MKLEPVAWMDDFGNAFPLAANKGAGSWRDEHKRNWKPLYAIPEGYVVVPVEQLDEACESMELWGMHDEGSYQRLKASCNEAMIAAKEQQ